MEASLFNCCGSSKWSKGVAALGPFDDRAKLLEAARKVWWNDCNVTDWLEAFTAHPRIGVSVQEIEARVVGDERGRVEVEGSIPVSCVFFRRERERRAHPKVLLGLFGDLREVSQPRRQCSRSRRCQELHTPGLDAMAATDAEVHLQFILPFARPRWRFLVTRT